MASLGTMLLQQHLQNMQRQRDIERADRIRNEDNLASATQMARQQQHEMAMAEAARQQRADEMSYKFGSQMGMQGVRGAPVPVAGGELGMVLGESAGEAQTAAAMRAAEEARAAEERARDNKLAIMDAENANKLGQMSQAQLYEQSNSGNAFGDKKFLQEERYRLEHANRLAEMKWKAAHPDAIDPIRQASDALKTREQKEKLAFGPLLNEIKGLKEGDEFKMGGVENAGYKSAVRDLEERVNKQIADAKVRAALDPNFSLDDAATLIRNSPAFSVLRAKTVKRSATAPADDANLFGTFPEPIAE